MTRPTMSGQCGLPLAACIGREGCVCLSVPSPCDRRNRLRVLWTDPTPCNHWLSYLIFRFSLPEYFSGVVRVSQETFYCVIPVIRVDIQLECNIVINRVIFQRCKGNAHTSCFGFDLA